MQISKQLVRTACATIRCALTNDDVAQVLLATGRTIEDIDEAYALAMRADIIAKAFEEQTPDPIPMRLPCPECGELHIDDGDFATKPHHTHACQKCGNVWRPAIVATVGVRFLPGFKNP